MAAKYSTFLVLIPVRNEAPTILRALRSLSQQTFQNWLAIVSDNNSSDGSLELIQNFSNLDKRFTLLSNHTDMDIDVHAKKIISYSEYFFKSKYVMFLHGDDFFDNSNYLQSFIEADSDFDIALPTFKDNGRDIRLVFSNHKIINFYLFSINWDSVFLYLGIFESDFFYKMRNLLYIEEPRFKHHFSNKFKFIDWHFALLLVLEAKKIITLKDSTYRKCGKEKNRNLEHYYPSIPVEDIDYPVSRPANLFFPNLLFFKSLYPVIRTFWHFLLIFWRFYLKKFHFIIEAIIITSKLTQQVFFIIKKRKPHYIIIFFPFHLLFRIKIGLKKVFSRHESL